MLLDPLCLNLQVTVVARNAFHQLYLLDLHYSPCVAAFADHQEAAAGSDFGGLSSDGDRSPGAHKCGAPEVALTSNSFPGAIQNAGSEFKP